jgi:hypothetical protein
MKSRLFPHAGQEKENVKFMKAKDLDKIFDDRQVDITDHLSLSA